MAMVNLDRGELNRLRWKELELKEREDYIYCLEKAVGELEQIMQKEAERSKEQ